VSIVDPTMWGPSASGQAREAMRRNMLEQLPEALVAGLQVMRDRPDSTPLLASIDVPTLVFGGTADAITPYPSMAALAEGLPRCEAAWLDGAGHLACFERPAEFHALLERFVRTVAPAR
jgi:pimeloyl-ACP methyl ester carboxylesterase